MSVDDILARMRKAYNDFDFAQVFGTGPVNRQDWVMVLSEEMYDHYLNLVSGPGTVIRPYSPLTGELLFEGISCIKVKDNIEEPYVTERFAFRDIRDFVKEINA